MTSLFLEHLDSAGLLGEHAAAKVATFPIAKLLKIAEATTEATSPEAHQRESSIYAQWAAKSFAGGREPCADLPCRLGRADQLARYATLYADRIYIHNFLSDFARRPPQRHNEQLFRRVVADDLRVLRLWRPLIESGRIIPLSPEIVHCSRCLAKLTFGPGAEVRAEHERAKLNREFCANVTLELRPGEDPNEFEICAQGPHDLVDHGSLVWSHQPSRTLLRAYLDFVSKGNGDVMRIPDRFARSQIKNNLASTVWQSVSLEMVTSQSVGTSFVTDRALDVRLLAALSGRADLEERNRIAQQYLTTMVPYAADVALPRLAVLRDREQEAFQEFRAALNAAVDEYRTAGCAFTERDARTLHDDVIAPKLAALDRKVTKAKRDLVVGAATTTGGWAAALSFGVYAGLVPPTLVAAATALGLLKVAADVTSNLMKISTATDAARGDEFYFLWRLSKLATA